MSTPLTYRSGRKPGIERWFAFAAIVLLSVGFILPFLWMVSTSLKTLDQAMAFPPTYIPNPPQPRNYLYVLRNPKMHFALFTRNTLIIAVLSVAGQVFSASLVAYGFARIPFKGRGLLFTLMLATMMIPFAVTMVSLFSIFRFLGDHHLGQWLGTYKPLWVPAWFGSAFNIFLLRQFFMTVPKELSEAARIDGCSEFGIYWRIMLPLSRPALAVVALFSFMGAWRDFLGPLVYLQDQDQYTLSLGLYALQSAHGGIQFHHLMAASVLVISPVLILFFLAQRTFIQGIATTGLKG